MTNSPSFAQTAKERNDTVFAHAVALINTHEGDSLYALLTDAFRSKISREVFAGITKNNLYPLGKIREYDLIEFKDGVSAYKANCSGAAIEFRIGTDTESRISSLRFLPYKSPVAEKSIKSATNNPLRTETDRKLDTVARDYIDKVNTAGEAISIYKDGVVTNYGYGETKKGTGIIPGDDVIFEIGSVTKTFTATLLAYYVVTDKVALSDPITKYLPDSVAANKWLQRITLQMLANHTSGLPRLPDNIYGSNTDLLNPYNDYDEQKLFAYLKKCTLKSVPGETYAYSNLAAGLLGVILERISGKPYEELVSGIICKPLGMTNTFQHPDAGQRQREVAVYNEKGDSVIMWDVNCLSGAGAIRADAADMMKYVMANMKEDSTPLSKAMQLTHKVTFSKEAVVGLGWHISKISGTDCYWHNGGTGGSRSYVAFIPDKKAALLILSNSAADVDDEARDILKLLQ